MNEVTNLAQLVGLFSPILMILCVIWFISSVINRVSIF
jgi:hypothetical protein